MFVSSCNTSDFEEPNLEIESFGKFSQEQIIYDESGSSYVTYMVYSDDLTALDNYLKGDFILAKTDDTESFDDTSTIDESEDLNSETQYNLTITSVFKEMKLSTDFNNSYRIEVTPAENDTRWNYTGLIYGPPSYNKFKVNRHTGWHKVYVASYYQDGYGNLYQREEPFTVVPNNAASIGYNRCYDDVYKWTINIQYRKSKHYSYNFYFTYPCT